MVASDRLCAAWLADFNDDLVFTLADAAVDRFADLSVTNCTEG